MNFEKKMLQLGRIHDMELKAVNGILKWKEQFDAATEEEDRDMKRRKLRRSERNLEKTKELHKAWDDGEDIEDKLPPEKEDMLDYYPNPPRDANLRKLRSFMAARDKAKSVAAEEESTKANLKAAESNMESAKKVLEEAESSLVSAKKILEEAESKLEKAKGDLQEAMDLAKDAEEYGEAARNRMNKAAMKFHMSRHSILVEYDDDVEAVKELQVRVGFRGSVRIKEGTMGEERAHGLDLLRKFAGSG